MNKRTYTTLSLLCLLFAGLPLTKNQAQSPGSLDAQFGSGGIVQASFSIFSSECRNMTLQSDGKIVLGGIYLSGGLGKMAFARFNSNGTFDNTFGTGGTSAIPFDNDKVTLGAIKAIAGGKTLASGSSNNVPTIIRLTNAGTLDNTFGTSGMAQFSGNMTGISDIAVLPNGKIVGCGLADPGTGKVFAVFRRNADGSADNTFGANGFAYADVGSQPTLNRMALQSDGKIVVTGTSYNSTTKYDLVLFRFTANGVADNTFGANGMVTTVLSTTNAYEQGNAITVQFDNKIVVAARIANAGPTVFSIVRYNTNGTLDNSFGTNGSTVINFNNSLDEPKGIAVQTDGKIVVAGTSLVGSDRQFAVARLTKTGALDNTFDSDGKVTTLIGTKAWGEGLALQSDGKIVVAGYADISGLRQFVAARYNVGTVVGTQEPENTLLDLQVYPNPLASGSLCTVRFELRQAETCRFDLLGPDGRLLRTFPQQQLSAGVHSIQVEMPAGLPVGPAWICVETASGTTARMQVMLR